MGLYAGEKIHKRFVEEYPKARKYKLDSGKSCIRFKKMANIPFDSIGELIRKFTPQQ